MDINCLQRMIYKTNKLANVKSSTKLKVLKTSTHDSSLACGSAYLQQKNFLTPDLSVQLQMLKDFFDICNVIEKINS